MQRTPLPHIRCNCKGALLFSVLLAACSAADSGPESGGVLPVTLEEIARLGDESAGDTLLFAPINQVAINSRGDFIVHEQRPLAVRAFGVDGAPIGDVGREGGGPGEYRWVHGVVTGPEDSVYVWDGLLNRVLVYDPHDFTFVRHATVEDDGQKQFTDLIGVFSSGWLMAAALPDFMPTEGGTMEINPDNHREVRVVNPDGSYGPEIVAIQRAREMIRNIQEGGGFNFVGVPFARTGTWDTGPDDLLYLGWSDSIRIAVTSVDGSIQSTIRHSHDPVPITDAEMAEAEYTEVELFRELLAAREPHATKPAFQTFVVDDAGHVWIKLSAPEDATSADWLILDGDGKAVGELVLPLAVDLEAIRESRAYGTHQEPGRDPMVVVYDILR